MLLNYFVLFLFIVTLIVLIRLYIQKNTVALSKPLPLANNNSEMNQYTQRFNAEWPSHLETKISKQMVNEFPHISKIEIPNLWYELKTYLYLASLVKTLPMFSKEIDLVWHEMLEHEEEYNAFCKRFCGHIIEHHPHDTPKHLPKERAFFNILYRGMFPTSESNHYWGSFVSEEDQMSQWINRIETDPDDVYEETCNKNTSSQSDKVYLSFLQSNQKEIQYCRTLIAERQNTASIPSNDLVWLYSLGAISGTFYEEDLDDLKTNSFSDNAMFNTSSSSLFHKKSEDNYIDSDNNLATHSSSNSNDNSSYDSHSSSSCSSSSCSSCSSCSS